MDSTETPSDRRQRLADLQDRIRALEAGRPLGDEPMSPGERNRVVSLEVSLRLRRGAERDARRKRKEFDAALDAVIDRSRTRNRSPVTTSDGEPLPPFDSMTAADQAELETALAALIDRIQQRAAAGTGHRDPPPQPTFPPRQAFSPTAPAHWSPHAVPGYRMWEVRNGLQGVYLRWDSPIYEAGCLGRKGATERHDDEVPHTDGRCGRPPCGLYAAREAMDLDFPALVSPGTRRFAVGLVALSGKVVEHTNGYRARRAEVRALAVLGKGVVVFIDDRQTIARVFANPPGALAEIEAERPESIRVVGDNSPGRALNMAADLLRTRLWTT
ncbi:hypothetical protein HQ535_11745 [bacterium]|nr:hypothetical protein [bacterium]